MTSLVVPLLHVRFENRGKIDLTGVAALAFTSANGVRAFAATTPERDLPVFAVGRGTAAVARAAGFASIRTSNSDVTGLASAIATVANDGLVLHPGAAEPAGNLIDTLDAMGVQASGLVVYRTTRADLSDADRGVAAASDFVLLQSIKAARIFKFLGLGRPTPICLSPAIASILSSRGAVTARTPTEDALIAALVEAAR